MLWCFPCHTHWTKQEIYRGKRGGCSSFRVSPVLLFSTGFHRRDMKENLQIVALQLLSALQSCSCAEPLMLSESELSRRLISVFLHLFCSERISWSPAADLEHQKSHHQHPTLQTGHAGRRLTFFPRLIGAPAGGHL